MKDSSDGSAEAKWIALWDAQEVHRYDASRGREQTFVVDTPPPTVSGDLHIGHCFSYTHTDLIVRYRRMQDFNIFYPMGWDDNGLPTERRVQELFRVRCSPHLPYDPSLTVDPHRTNELLPVSRRNFIELCQRVAEEDEKQFKRLWQHLGLSVDWSQTYATIDRRSQLSSQYAFLQLVRRGQAQLRQAPTMWDTEFETAVAQAEVEDRTIEGAYYRIRFEADGGEGFAVDTTRPELLPACIAVVTHPQDDRYGHLVGRRAITPLLVRLYQSSPTIALIPNVERELPWCVPLVTQVTWTGGDTWARRRVN